MNAWDIYKNRATVQGLNQKETTLKRETHFINSKIRDSLSYQTVEIDGMIQEVAIINTDILTEKFIYSLPGEDITHGGLVLWMNNYWLITEKDANSTLYTRAKMLQCNHLLKWVSDDKTIHEQWCVVEDGTKYLTGEYEDRNFIVTRGDSRIAITLPRNEHTIKLDRERRFLVDDNNSDTKIAYLLTKPLKIGNVFNGKGVFKFVLQEVTSTDNDNHELGIADYYSYFPKNTTIDIGKEIVVNTDEEKKETERKVWL